MNSTTEQGKYSDAVNILPFSDISIPKALGISVLSAISSSARRHDPYIGYGLTIEELDDLYSVHGKSTFKDIIYYMLSDKYGDLITGYVSGKNSRDPFATFAGQLTDIITLVDSTKIPYDSRIAAIADTAERMSTERIRFKATGECYDYHSLIGLAFGSGVATVIIHKTNLSDLPEFFRFSKTYSGFLNQVAYDSFVLGYQQGWYEVYKENGFVRSDLTFSDFQSDMTRNSLAPLN
jgi:hypothetical protein